MPPLRIDACPLRLRVKEPYMQDRFGLARHIFEREWERTQRRGRRPPPPDLAQPPVGPHNPPHLSGGAAAPIE
jgi:hypothetical protein